MSFFLFLKLFTFPAYIKILLTGKIMDLKTTINELKIKYHNFRDKVVSESNTEIWFISPFLQGLGYDTHDPGLVHTQYQVMPNGHKVGKVDYAILQDKKPIIFLEGKKLGESLDGHIGQVKKYFNLKTEVDFAILTNGNEYQIYSDLDHENVLDDKPFLEFKVHKIDVQQDKELIAYLEKFSLQNYDSTELKNLAHELSRKEKILSFLKKEFSSPSDDFVKFISYQIFRTNKRSIRNLVKSSLPEIYSELKGTAPSETTHSKDQRGKYVQKIIKPDPSQEQNPFEIEKPAGKKLEYWRFMNTITYGTWTDMFVGVLRSLCKEDRTRLEAISISTSGLKISDNPDENGQKHPIGQSLFVSTGIGTPIKIRILGEVLSSFGKKNSLRVKLK